MGKAEAVDAYVLHHVSDGQHWSVLGLDLHLPPFISLHGLMVLIGAGLVYLLFARIYRRDEAVPRGVTNLLESMVLFVRDQIVYANLGEENGRRMAPLLLTQFFFILTLNLMGMLPVFVTATGNINVTAALALVTLGTMIGGGIQANGAVGFFRGFLPHGVPTPVLPLLFLVEFLGIFIKAFALCIRLFANMLAGHIVIFSLIGLVVSFGLIALPAVAAAVAIGLLELFVAFLQAYIFTMLSSIFIGMTLHPEH